MVGSELFYLGILPVLFRLLDFFPQVGSYGWTAKLWYLGPKGTTNGDDC